ncbi:MAG: hypothetical protein AB1521_17875 [Bacteroidota bacterium]
MKRILKFVLYSLLLFFFLYACEYNSVYEEEKEIFGVKGVVRNYFGEILDSVEVYYLFNYNSALTDRLFKESVTLLEPSSFDFKLYQNYPNPFSNYSFIKFSLPLECDTKLSIQDIRTSKDIYVYQAKLKTGLYQIAIGKIVDSLKMVNGIYRYQINAKDQNNIRYEDSKEFTIIRGTNYPYQITDNTGIFIFNYEDAFIAKTIIENYYDREEMQNTRFVTNTINLLFRRKGYQDAVQTYTLYPNLLLHHDVLMESW